VSALPDAQADAQANASPAIPEGRKLPLLSRDAKPAQLPGSSSHPADLKHSQDCLFLHS